MSTTRTAGPVHIVARAPATSANLGPGFDCLGLALDLWNEVAATVGGDVQGGADRADDRPPNLIEHAAQMAFREAGVEPPSLHLDCVNTIPFGRGLGSSSAAIACGMLVANAYLRNALSADDLLRLGTRLEGHPDNMAPCLLGGVRVSVLAEDGSVKQSPVPTPARIYPVVFVPDVPLPTVEARAVLPSSVPYHDALFNVARASLLVAAFATGDFSLVREATRDRLHQPYREPLFPAGRALMDAADAAGALGACVSGAGPTILAFCGDQASAVTVMAEMAAAAAAAQVAGRPQALGLTQVGAHVVED